MPNDSPERPPKVAIYDRPAGADRRRGLWVAVVTGMAAVGGWLIYWLWSR